MMREEGKKREGREGVDGTYMDTSSGRLQHLRNRR
jgi:hypothetical protein